MGGGKGKGPVPVPGVGKAKIHARAGSNAATVYLSTGDTGLSVPVSWFLYRRTVQ